jgi:TetR/AcrR family transcriptional repressor of mexJK operon
MSSTSPEGTLVMPTLVPELRRSDRKRKLILDAATTAFLTAGYDGTSMDDVAALAAVSKPTVYKHFTDKERLFAEIILATTDQVDELVRLVASTLADTDDVAAGLNVLAHRIITALMQPELLRLRRLVIASADRFPEVSRTWYERGFERVLATLATSFQRLADQQLLHLDDPLLAANHFVGLLLWIPVNKAMFSGHTQVTIQADLERYAAAAVRVFLAAYGQPTSRSVSGPTRGARGTSALGTSHRVPQE